MKYIFEEIIETRVIFKQIEENASNIEDKDYMHALVKDIFHHQLVDLVLDELDENKKMIFLGLVDKEEHHNGTIELLSQWITDFEAKLMKRVSEAEEETRRVMGF